MKKIENLFYSFMGILSATGGEWLSWDMLHPCSTEDVIVGRFCPFFFSLEEGSAVLISLVLSGATLRRWIREQGRNNCWRKERGKKAKLGGRGSCWPMRCRHPGWGMGCGVPLTLHLETSRPAWSAASQEGMLFWKRKRGDQRSRACSERCDSSIMDGRAGLRATVAIQRQLVVQGNKKGKFLKTGIL